MASEKREEYLKSCARAVVQNIMRQKRLLRAKIAERFYTSGIEVENKESTKLYEEIKKRRKKETEADKERE